MLDALVIPLSLRAPKPPVGASDSVEVDTDEAEHTREERTIRCGRCATDITRTSAAISVAGQHTHVFVNPAGMPFDIACYRAAPGCAEHGAPETFWSWFAGYAWRLAACRQCGTQLGWSYVGERDHFFGLIRARLSE